MKKEQFIAKWEYLIKNIADSIDADISQMSNEDRRLTLKCIEEDKPFGLFSEAFKRGIEHYIKLEEYAFSEIPEIEKEITS